MCGLVLYVFLHEWAISWLGKNPIVILTKKLFNWWTSGTSWQSPRVQGAKAQPLQIALSVWIHPNGPSSERIPGSLLPKSQRGNVFSLRKLPVLPSSSTRHIHLSLCLKCPGLKEQSRGYVLNIMTLCIQATSDSDLQWTSGPGQPIHSLIWPGRRLCPLNK